MSGDPRRAAILEHELRVLRALCLDAHGFYEREPLIEKLNDYTWADDEHRVVFAAIAGLRQADAATLRALLPAAATRMGFPEISWDDYFAADAEDNISIQDHLGALLRAQSL